MRLFIGIMVGLSSAKLAMSFPDESLIRKLMNESSYAAASSHLARLLDHNLLPPSDQTQALWLYGICHVSLDLNAEAEHIFGKLLQITPDYYPGADTSPKITTSFIKAREKFYAAHARDPAYLASISSHREEGEVLYLELTVGTAIKKAATHIYVRYRTFEQPVFRSKVFTLSHQDKETLAVSLPEEKSKLLYYYLEFVGRYDAPFFSIGSFFNPISLAHENPKPNWDKTSETPSTFTQLKAGWPILFSTLLVVAGALTYSLLKLNN